MASILDTTKKMLGLDTADTSFDTDIIVNINAVFMTLNQLGIGPETGFSIIGKDETWETFLGEDDLKFSAIKSYMALKVRLLFDPPASSFVLESMSRFVTEFEWRLTNQAEEPVVPVTPPEGE